MIRAEVIRSGGRAALEAEENAPLSALLAAAGAPPDLPCGGRGSCGRCAVRASGALSEPTAAETAVFGREGIEQGWRLACQSRALGDVTLRLGEELYEQIVSAGETPDFPQAPLFRRWGLAVDIGTTTLSAQLWGRDGLSRAVTMKNPQTAFGADVITRIEKSLAGAGDALAHALRAALSSLTEALAAGAGIAPAEIDAAVLAGNTAMLYLLTGRNPEALSHAPFEADCLFGEFAPARELVPALSDGARLYLPRCFSAFVGADIAAGILAAGMCGEDTTALLADIGTNGEIALWHEGRLYCCSTAAGPAFEGVGIRMGVYGVAGAIDKVWCADGGLRVSTIGGGKAVGICGSGIVDALAAMLRCGAVSETGALEKTGHSLEAEVTELNGETALHLADGVVLTARDIRMVQLAKGSVRAGMETLLRTAGVKTADVGRFFIAGGFGSYLNLESAARIGLIPAELTDRARVIGNAAQAGASMLLRNEAFADALRRLADNAQTVRLDANPVFMDEYVTHMCFETDD